MDRASGIPIESGIRIERDYFQPIQLGSQILRVRARSCEYLSEVLSTLEVGSSIDVNIDLREPDKETFVNFNHDASPINASLIDVDFDLFFLAILKTMWITIFVANY